MEEKALESVEIKETDIVFDCPYCSKSLAIDYRGAGLTVPCTDCGKRVQVPIPEGMELRDLDSSQEEQSLEIRNLRKLLSASESRVDELEAEIESLRKAAAGSGEATPHLPSEVIQDINEQVEAMRSAVAGLTAALDKISALARAASPSSDGS